MADKLKTVSNILFAPALIFLAMVLITTPSRLDHVKQASYDSGYSVGYDEGYNVGCKETSDESKAEISEARQSADSAYDDGHTDGYAEGYTDGYGDCLYDYDIDDPDYASPQTTEETVYITTSGSKYHRSGCSYLRKSQIAISLSDAKSRGYTACSRCF